MEIVKGVHMVTGPYGGNVFLVKVKNDFMLIDTGMPRSAKSIERYIRRFDRSISDLKLLVLTHCHLDHSGSAHAIVEDGGAKVCAHRSEAEFVEGRQPLPAPDIAGVRGTLTRASMRPGRYHPVRVDHQLSDGQLVGPLRTIHLPGHTPGSIGLLYPEHGLLFCGDAMTTLEDNLNGPPAEFTADAEQARRSALRIAELAPKLVCPGHGPVLRVEDASLWGAFAEEMGGTKAKPSGGRRKAVEAAG